MTSRCPELMKSAIKNWLMSKNGFSIEDRPECVKRYHYDFFSEESAKRDAEDNDLIIIDESDDEDEEFWFDAIDPKHLEANIRTEETMYKMSCEMAEDISNEIDKEILDKLCEIAKKGPIC